MNAIDSFGALVNSEAIGKEKELQTTVQTHESLWLDLGLVLLRWSLERWNLILKVPNFISMKLML